jgi:hypothetical protein
VPGRVYALMMTEPSEQAHIEEATMRGDWTCRLLWLGELMFLMI